MNDIRQFLKTVPFWLEAVLVFLVILLFPLGGMLSINYPNVILEQGLSHRIFYFHVAVAWVALYGPLFSSIAAIIYIINRKQTWDIASYSFNQLSVLFAIAVLFSGPIWAKSAWGVPWDWTDARLQSFFILSLSLLSYFIVRNLITDVEKKGLFSAYLSLLCAMNAVITWGAIRWVENPGNHPSSVLGKGGMDSDMKLTFWISVIGYHLIFLLYQPLISVSDLQGLFFFCVFFVLKKCFLVLVLAVLLFLMMLL